MKFSIPLFLLLASFLSAQETELDRNLITATSPDEFGPEFASANTLDGETLEGYLNLGDSGPPERPAGHQNNHWITPNLAPDGAGQFTSTITFDLGDSYDLSRIEILNTSNTNWNDRETDTFTIATSTDQGTTFSAPSSPVALQSYEDGFQSVPLVAENVTTVQLQVSNDPLSGTNTGTDDVGVGLNEVRFFITLPPDSDDDGLPDTWELENFGDLSRGPDDDDDLPAPDGLTNLEEFEAESDPRDPDSDDDTLTDFEEVRTHGSNPNLSDSDGDQLSDSDEVRLHNSDPSLVDTDGDELSDFDEVTIHQTRPDLADSDGDNLPDGLEIIHLMSDPLVPNSRPTLVPPYEITVTAGSVYSMAFVASNLVDDRTLEGFTNLGDSGPPQRPAGHQNNHWITPDNTLSETVTFDLGGSYDLTRIEVLNTSNTNWNDRETDTLTVATSTDGGASYSAPGLPVTLQDYTAGFQSIPLTAPDVTHVQILVTNDPFLGTDIGTPDIAVGLNEVRFYLGNLVPPQITAVDLLNQRTSAQLTWNSTPGAQYLIEFSDNLIQWQGVPGADAVPASEGATTTLTVPFDPPAPVVRRFFRVTQLP